MIFFLIFIGTWCKSALNGGSDGGTMRFKPECDHGGNAGKNLFAKKKNRNCTLKFEIFSKNFRSWNCSRSFGTNQEKTSKRYLC